jgi:hypothetical protein
MAGKRVRMPDERHTLDATYKVALTVPLPGGMHPEDPAVEQFMAAVRSKHEAFAVYVQEMAKVYFGRTPTLDITQRIDPMLKGGN